MYGNISKSKNLGNIYSCFKIDFNRRHNITLKKLISVIRRKYCQKVKYITAQKALSSYKIKSSIVLKNSYGFLNGLIFSFKTKMRQLILELDNDNTFKKYFMYGMILKNSMIYVEK
ncbi:hypothetical protein CDIK_2538 [Cucumispora dikerogammari]|nr:hypothetical protein CDIK_2538 [Cucumispora dikerogammari]